MFKMIKKVTYPEMAVMLLFMIMGIAYSIYGISIKKAFFSEDLYGVVVFCMSDIVCIVFGCVRFAVIVVAAVLLIIRLKAHFKSTVMVLRKSRMAILTEMYKQAVVIALAVTAAAFVLVMIVGFIYADVWHCNWNDNTSYAYAYRGDTQQQDFLSVWGVLLLYIFEVFFSALVPEMLTILSWYCINPVTGVVATIILYRLEVGAIPPVFKLFFYYVSINASGLYYDGLDLTSILLPIAVVVCIIVTLNMLIVRRKNLLY